MLYGEKQTTRQKNNAEGKFNIKETDMIENFDKLNLDDQDEIIEFLNESKPLHIDRNKVFD